MSTAVAALLVAALWVLSASVAVRTRQDVEKLRLAAAGAWQASLVLCSLVFAAGLVAGLLFLVSVMWSR